MILRSALSTEFLDSSLSNFSWVSVVSVVFPAFCSCIRSAIIFSLSMEIASAYRLCEDDVPGASLTGKSVDLLTIVELKRWLACRGARRSGKKPELQKR